MSWGIRDRKTARNTSAGAAVCSNAMYGKAKSSVSPAPSMYIRLRPIRSDRWPKNGTLNRDSAAAAMTA
jgi:cyanophycinase-like exopeptidase